MYGNQFVKLRLAGYFALCFRSQLGLIRKDIDVLPLGIRNEREVTRQDSGLRPVGIHITVIGRPGSNLVLRDVVDTPADAGQLRRTHAPVQGFLERRAISWHDSMN
jgi:hypothetical protein